MSCTESGQCSFIMLRTISCNAAIPSPGYYRPGCDWIRKWSILAWQQIQLITCTLTCVQIWHIWWLCSDAIWQSHLLQINLIQFSSQKTGNHDTLGVSKPNWRIPKFTCNAFLEFEIPQAVSSLLDNKDNMVILLGMNWVEGSWLTYVPVIEEHFLCVGWLAGTFVTYPQPQYLAICVITLHCKTRMGVDIYRFISHALLD